MNLDRQNIFDTLLKLSDNNSLPKSSGLNSMVKYGHNDSTSQDCTNMVNAAKKINNNDSMIFDNTDYKSFVDHYKNYSTCDIYSQKIDSLVESRSATRPNCKNEIKKFITSAVNFWDGNTCQNDQQCAEGVICLFSPQDQIPFNPNTNVPVTNCSLYQEKLDQISQATSDQTQCFKCNNYQPL